MIVLNNDLLTTDNAMIHWYKVNFLPANHEKFQFIVFDKGFAFKKQCNSISARCKLLL